MQYTFQDELLDTINSGVAVYEVRNDGASGRDYIVIDFNRFALEHEGLVGEQVVGKNLLELRPTIDDFGLISVFRQVWKTGEPGFFPARVYIDEQYSNWYENRVFRLSQDRIVAIYDDVTERKRAELALEASEGLLREVIDSLDTAIAIYEAVDDGHDFVFVSMNKGAELLTHYKQPEVVGRRLSELFPGEPSIGLIATLRQVWETGETARIPLKQYRDERLTVWVENTIFKLPTGEVVAIFEDTHERRMAEEALRRSEARYRRAEEIGRVGNWEYDVRAGTFWGSEQSTRVFGFDPAAKSVSAQQVEDRITDSGRVRQAMLELIAGEQPRDLVFQVVVPGEEPKTISCVARLVRDEAGLPLKVVGFLQDITEKQRQQDKIRALESQVQQSQKLETVGRLAGGVAHDFNNLLTIIGSYAELALGELRREDPLHGHLTEIAAAGERAAGLTRQILAFSRKQVLVPKVLDLNEAVADLGRMLQRILGEDIDLRTQLAADLGAVHADPSQLGQVLLNLAVNARDAMPRGGVLTISTANVELQPGQAAAHPELEAGPYVMLSVADTGEGMSPETQARVFEPFFTTKETGQGTGLGLSTVYGIVRQSGGDITLRSEPGQGTTFRVRLPRVRGQVAARSLGGESSAPWRGSETVLIVEDEGAVRRLTKRILDRAGYQTLTAANGAEALRICRAREQPIDLVLTDVVMPGMSGHELVDRLARSCSSVKALYMSGYAGDTVARHGVLDASAPLIRKPFDSKTLVEMVRSVLDGD